MIPKFLSLLQMIHGFFSSGEASLIGKPSFVEKKWQKVHEKWIFQPVHNETKSVLSIKESYSIKKSPKIFTKAFGQAGMGSALLKIGRGPVDMFY